MKSSQLLLPLIGIAVFVSRLLMYQNNIDNHGRLKTLEKTEGAIKNVQSKDTDNIGHTRHRTKTNKA